MGFGSRFFPLHALVVGLADETVAPVILVDGRRLLHLLGAPSAHYRYVGQHYRWLVSPFGVLAQKFHNYIDGLFGSNAQWYALGPIKKHALQSHRITDARDVRATIGLRSWRIARAVGEQVISCQGQLHTLALHLPGKCYPQREDAQQ